MCHPSCRPNLLLPRIGGPDRASVVWTECIQGPIQSVLAPARPEMPARLGRATRCHHFTNPPADPTAPVAPGRGCLVEAATEQRFDGRRARAGPVTLGGPLRITERPWTRSSQPPCRPPPVLKSLWDPVRLHQLRPIERAAKLRPIERAALSQNRPVQHRLRPIERAALDTEHPGAFLVR